ncbi:MAG: RNA polymerase sigma factor FliA [Candidatus Dactylopiibacterium carminicum]|uniref:FliA/WhiG family RNA polymerase sigma factor n=1 Tax=Candidatus Dactylopiibacterium carminicum TaxID=857335 RepID=A0A272EWM0_9RHOO|nr:RNA polymerase sigma factor FliA [Candidatus Dactylopiibacterium carminicum]KAF7599963.1 FliA/WhiG family RNA polymerase sigma factor [Candidatus Dactylopiibacterium carminicum]PAS94456.1 MAG: RNA polymerase sigma factor FliA [Candidatus Dactylopiibacterium carminicum]PAS97059.1 MAG: RNA polymerase sigma factor FliA [Candidatus Dactylopiibacterium carminicum]PAS99966.1 MAG: RNA polymerase sigma factor FliA [Candidatus Dactylopiibacterium carminicum]
MDMNMGYAQTCEAAVEQQHLLAYLPLVKRVVRQLASQTGGAIDRQDMEQIGLLGLLDCLRRYGTPDEKFGAYAQLRVRGAILDELRRQDWRPRSVRQESHRLRDAIRDLARRLGHEPGEAEVQQHLGLSAEAYQAYLMAENAEALASFDEMIQILGEQASEQPTPETQLMRRRSIEQALRRLDEREQRVIQLYYEFDLSLKEIAAVLELTEARVCQINKGALRKMRECLQSH